jgi:hypothetical protein
MGYAGQPSSPRAAAATYQQQHQQQYQQAQAQQQQAQAQAQQQMYAAGGMTPQQAMTAQWAPYMTHMTQVQQVRLMQGAAHRWRRDSYC